ncbi:hypothetical protein Mgra_00007274, partial [Meloidogyne graminicola]
YSIILILCFAILEIESEFQTISIDPPTPNNKENKNFLDKEWLFNKFYKNMENKNEKITKYDCKIYEEIEVCGCLFNGKKPVNFVLPKADSYDAENYLKSATIPMCGHKYFNYIKQCALTNMFEDKNPKTVPADNKTKKILIILDGCATCLKGGKITGFKVTHYEDSFGIFSGCSEEKEFEDFAISGLSIKLNKGNKIDGSTASFSIPVILYHRICDGIFSKSVASNKYIDIKLQNKYF